MRTHTFRILITITLSMSFIASGLTKAVDPIGFAYKLNEYAHYLQSTFLGNFSKELSLLIIILELFIGGMLILNICKRVISIMATLLLITFTVLTFSIYIDPYGSIRECGCFGEAFPLSKGASLIKSFSCLLVAIINVIYTYTSANSAINKINNTKSLVFICATFILACVIPIYSYIFLPPFDFLPYNIGAKINSDFVVYDIEGNKVKKDQFLFSDKPTYMFISQKGMQVKTNKHIQSLKYLASTGVINLISISDGPIIGETLDNIRKFQIDGVTLKSLVRSPLGIIAINNDKIIGKWSVENTTHSFGTTTIDSEYQRERWKQTSIIILFFIGCILLYTIKRHFYNVNFK